MPSISVPPVKTRRARKRAGEAVCYLRKPCHSVFCRPSQEKRQSRFVSFPEGRKGRLDIAPAEIDYGDEAARARPSRRSGLPN